MSHYLMITGFDFPIEKIGRKAVFKKKLKTTALEYFSEQFSKKIGLCDDGLPKATKKINIKRQPLVAPISTVFEEAKNVVDEAVSYLIVYESPEVVFSNAYISSSGDLENAEKVLHEWKAKSLETLKFLSENEENCRLVHFSSLWNDPQKYKNLYKLSLGMEPERISDPYDELISSLKVLAPYLISDMTKFLEVYDELQLKAEIPGERCLFETKEDSNYYAILEAKKILSLKEDLESVIELQNKCRNLELELGLSTLQIKYLQEELEDNFLRSENFCQTITSEHLKGKALKAYKEVSSAKKVKIIGSYSDENYLDIRLELLGVSLFDGRYFDLLRCKLVLMDEKPAVEFRLHDNSDTETFQWWPENMRDGFGPYILFSPFSGDDVQESEKYINQVGTLDRQLILGVINILNISFIESTVIDSQILPPENVRSWRMAIEKLNNHVTKSFPLVTVDDVSLKEEFSTSNYRHIWVECKNLQFENLIYPYFSFKVAALEVRARWNLQLEFRSFGDNVAPLKSWPPLEGKDEFGDKQILSLRCRAKKIFWEPLSEISDSDLTFIKNLSSKIPGWVGSFIKSQEISDEGGDFWLNKVESLKVDGGTSSERMEKRIRRALFAKDRPM
jgi:hypothetical protein